MIASAATARPLRPPLSIQRWTVDMRFGFELEVAFFGVLAVVALEGALDIDRVGVVAFDQVAVVAVHRPHEIGERGQQALRQGAPEAGALLRQLQREIV